MKCVLDASVALKWVLTEPDSPKAHSVRDDYRKQSHELLAPDVFPVEIAHALTRAERRGNGAMVKLSTVLPIDVSSE
jgi:predicted nucleic acid-binding protein